MDEMAALGARLLEKGGAIKTATEAQSEAEAETSIASMVAGNVSDAYSSCLMWMQMFNDGGETEAEYEINQDYINRDIDPQALTAILNGVMQGKIPESDFWDYLRRHSVISEEKDDEAIKDELETMGDMGIELEGVDDDDENDEDDEQDGE
jgi:hypothetical protein